MLKKWDQWKLISVSYVNILLASNWSLNISMETKLHAARGHEITTGPISSNRREWSTGLPLGLNYKLPHNETNSRKQDYHQICKEWNCLSLTPMSDMANQGYPKNEILGRTKTLIHFSYQIKNFQRTPGDFNRLSTKIENNSSSKVLQLNKYQIQQTNTSKPERMIANISYLCKDFQ